MRYDVGDEIKIREDLDYVGSEGEFDSTVGYAEEMAEWAGKVVTIVRIGTCSHGDYYRIKEDEGRWMWIDDMLDYSEEKESPKMETTYSVEHNAVQKINRAEIMQEMYDTLEICQIYHPTDMGINAILDKWEDAKGRTDIWKGHSVLDILSKHPDYVPSKGYIVKKKEYDRGVDLSVIDDVLSLIFYATENPATYNLLKEINIRPWSYEECKMYYNKLNNIGVAMYCDDDIRYKGMNREEVIKEAKIWHDRMSILENKYYISFDKCYEKEDKKKMVSVSVLIRDIKNYVHEKISNLTEEELLQPLLVDEKIVKFIEDSGVTVRGIRSGQKFNKVINKILTETGIKDNWAGYNREIARLGDAASPTKFTRFTIISANPLDYWRMSFGSSWKSCHTIDKEGYYRPSDGGDGYEGMHASGCSSYMLDPSSVVMYTVDKSYEGNDYELEPKINRCMFHIGEEKFVMGRVYPQGTDGEGEVYRQWRQIFQTIIAECMGVDNYWKTLKDRTEKFEQIKSHGTHYRDYEMGYCDIAGWSYLKPNANAKPSSRKINIGATPICPCCGEEHWVEDNVECENCNDDGVYCCDCGERHDREYMHNIGGDWYCEDCCFYCEYHGEWEVGESYYVNGYGDVCEYALDSGDFERCAWCEDYHYVGNCDDGITTEDGEWYCCENCVEKAGYVFCDDDECWHNKEDVFYCDECGRWVTENNWNEDEEMCVDCVIEGVDRETA